MRVDLLLVQRGLAPSRSAAQRLIAAGGVQWLGAQQIINKLKPGSPGQLDKNRAIEKDDVMTFTEDDEELMAAFASQASVAIENAKLTEDIENLFESFIRASVTAIESRDPSTSGHSDRVAVFTVEFARAVHQAESGPFKDVLFTDAQIRELRYTSLLHDFGKIGVRESVLSKQLKLYPHEMETILNRLETVRAKQEMTVWKNSAEELLGLIERGIKVESPKEYALKVANKIDNFAKQLQQVRLSIVKANQPQVIAGDFDIISLMTWINRTSQEIEQAMRIQTHHSFFKFMQEDFMKFIAIENLQIINRIEFG